VRVIDNLETSDQFNAALTIEDDQGGLLAITIANESALVKLRPARRESGGEQSYGPEVTFTPQTQAIPNVSGAKFRSKVVGAPARIIATLVSSDDPQIGAGIPFLQTLSAAGALGDVLTGAIFDYAGAVAPDGYLLCDGAAISRATFAALFTVIGVTFGVGDGSTTFNLPDLRGRTTVGLGSNVAVDTRGKNDGVAEANRRPQHRHTPHFHTLTGFQFGGPNATADGAAASPQANPTSSVDGGSGNANDSLDAPAYIVLNKIIKT